MPVDPSENAKIKSIDFLCLNIVILDSILGSPKPNVRGWSTMWDVGTFFFARFPCFTVPILNIQSASSSTPGGERGPERRLFPTAIPSRSRSLTGSCCKYVARHFCESLLNSEIHEPAVMHGFQASPHSKIKGRHSATNPQHAERRTMQCSALPFCPKVKN